MLGLISVGGGLHAPCDPFEAYTHAGHHGMVTIKTSTVGRRIFYYLLLVC